MHVEVCTTASAAWGVRCHLTTETMRDELASLTENGVYELCDLPVGTVALTS